MSNYPDDFKGTNMDERGDEKAGIALDAIESIGDKIEALLRELVKDYDLAITGKDIKQSMGYIHDAVEDLFSEERERLMERDGWRPNPRRPQPNFKSASELLLESFKPRILTNPATHAVMDEIAAQNKLASESEI